MAFAAIVKFPPKKNIIYILLQKSTMKTFNVAFPVDNKIDEFMTQQQKKRKRKSQKLFKQKSEIYKMQSKF